MSPADPIISTKDRPGSYDAIETAKPGEPLFPIQGGDPFGPPTVLHWANLARRAGMDSSDPKEAERLLGKARDAEFVAWTMVEYQRGEKPVEAQRARYNDAGPAEALEVRTEREALIAGTGKLNNCLAEALVVAETLAKLRTHPEDEVKIREAVALLREAAFGIEPRRGNERS